MMIPLQATVHSLFYRPDLFSHILDDLILKKEAIFKEVLWSKASSVLY